MRKVYCKKDLVYSKNGIQYFWAGESYEVSNISDSGITVYTEILANLPNNMRGSFFLKWDLSNLSAAALQMGVIVFSDYFIFLDEMRENKLKELGI